MGNLQITSPQPVALLRDYLWQLAVLAMSTPSSSTLFEECIFTPDNVITYPGVALLWVPTLGGAPARAPGGCVFEEQVGVGMHNARVSESTDDL